jgi:excisionase family DNA binding protein
MFLKAMGVISTNETAQRLRLSLRRVQTLIQRGQLRATKLGRDWMVDEKDLQEFARRPRKPGRPRKPYRRGK